MGLSRSRSARAALNDPRFESFAREHAGALIRLAHRLTMDRHRGEDVVQEVLLRCALRWPDIIKVDNPRAYLRRAVVNEVISMKRRGWAREWVRAELVDEATGATRFDESLADRDALRAALGTLNAVQRTVLVLRYYEDLADDEIAALLDCPSSTVRSHARRALARLRETVGDFELTGGRW
jgi:RNA polymerase sigma-70 factor (sigma-E family)